MSVPAFLLPRKGDFLHFHKSPKACTNKDTETLTESSNRYLSKVFHFKLLSIPTLNNQRDFSFKKL